MRLFTWLNTKLRRLFAGKRLAKVRHLDTKTLDYIFKYNIKAEFIDTVELGKKVSTMIIEESLNDTNH